MASTDRFNRIATNNSRYSYATAYNANNKTLSGRAPRGALVPVYVDNTLNGTATADDSGNWSLVLSGTINPGQIIKIGNDVGNGINQRVFKIPGLVSLGALSLVPVPPFMVVPKPTLGHFFVARIVGGSGGSFALSGEGAKGLSVSNDSIISGYITSLGTIDATEILSTAINSPRTTLAVAVVDGTVLLPRANPQFVSVNVQGMDSGPRGVDHTNDVAGTQYSMPTQADMNYLSARGVNVVRLPFQMERMVLIGGGDLNAPYLTNVITVLDRAAAATPTPIKVLLDSHNYAERHLVGGGVDKLGSTNYPIAHHVDMWRKIARAVRNHAGLWGYDIMNEPQGITSAVMADCMQQCVNMLATEDPDHWVVVEGNSYSNAHNWTGQNGAVYPLTDPADRIIYSAHMYADPGYGGNSTTYPTWASCVAAGSAQDQGVQNLQNFFGWLASTGKRGNVGEHGFYADGLPNAYNTFKAAVDKGVSAFAWQYGPSFGSDAFAIYPYDGTEQPHWSVLRRFTGVAPMTYNLDGVHGFKSGETSAPFKVTFNGYSAQTLTITPSDGGKGGTFAPASVTLAAGAYLPSATFTYSNSVVQTGITISTTNDRGLANPAGILFSTDAANPVNLQTLPLANWYTSNSGSPIAQGDYRRLTDNTSNAEHRYSDNAVSILPGQAVEVNVVFKNDNRRYGQLSIRNPDKPYELALIDFDTVAGTIGTPMGSSGVTGLAASIAVEGDGYRVRLAAVMGTAKRVNSIIKLADALGNIVYVGAGVPLLAKDPRVHQPATITPAAGLNYTDISWTGRDVYNASFTLDSGKAPDGSDSYRLSDNSSNTDHVVVPRPAISVPANQVRELIIFAKPDTITKACVRFEQSGNNVQAVFDLVNKTFVSSVVGSGVFVSAEIVTISGGWCLLKLRGKLGVANWNPVFTTANAAGATVYVGNGSPLYISRPRISDAIS